MVLEFRVNNSHSQYKSSSSSSSSSSIHPVVASLTLSFLGKKFVTSEAKMFASSLAQFSSSLHLRRTSSSLSSSSSSKVVVFAASNSDDVSKDNNSSSGDETIAAIERRLKNSKNKVKLTSKEKKERDSGFPKTNDAKKGRPATLFDDLGMKRSFPTPGANGMLSMWEGDPENWEKMEPLKKLWVVWSGEKGWMYWMNQASLYGAAFIAFLWVCFRFIGPILGLYELK